MVLILLPNSGSSPIKEAPAPPVKLSNDTERLQFIDSLRKGPAGAHIKHVIELLIEVSACFKASLYTRANNEACHNENDDGVIRYRVQLLVSDGSENSECLFSLL
ncbi:hypothetical protein F2Q68_00045627 [Brassica cretica]|uniref:Uncharacterized protein n=1 Tax=Brassica cretica TaxID=69181 RepID=A0A8S9LRZ7_BRACR|nr:hypothetical protein F2Q68_00045627 [Brassica cretica]